MSKLPEMMQNSINSANHLIECIQRDIGMAYEYSLDLRVAEFDIRERDKVERIQGNMRQICGQTVILRRLLTKLTRENQ